MVVQFHVPQQTVAVRVLLEDGSMIDGELYAPSVGADSDSQRLLDRLNDDAERFVPLARNDDNCLLQKAWVVWVQLNEAVDPSEPPSEPAGGLVHRLRLTLANGRTLSGAVSYVMRPERSRVLDFLNATPAFFAVRDGERITLVNRAFVQQVRDLSTSAPDD